MKELLKVEVNKNQEPIVSARALHEFLGSKERFSKWFDKMVDFGFVEHEDYTPYQMVHPQNDQEISDYALKLDMAKEVAMVSKLPKGKEARKHFIQVEKDFNSPEKVMARALLMANKQLEEVKPYARLGQAVSGSKTSILVGDMAKILQQNGIQTGQNIFFRWLRENGYLCKKVGEQYNMPTEYSMRLGLMEIKETIIIQGDKEIINKTPKITGRGQQYFIQKFLTDKKRVNLRRVK